MGVNVIDIGSPGGWIIDNLEVPLRYRQDSCDFGGVIGVDPAPAAAASFTVFLILSYWASMRFVFTRREGVSSGRKLGQSAVFFAIGPGVSETVMRVGVELVVKYQDVVYIRMVTNREASRML